MAIGYGFEDPQEFEERVRAYREARFGTRFERDPRTGEVRETIQVGPGSERLGKVPDTASILGAATYGRLNPTIEDAPPGPPPEQTPVPGRTMRMLPVEDQTALLRSVAPVSTPTPTPEKLAQPTAQDINRKIFDRLKALDFAGALRARNEAARTYPELFAAPPERPEQPEREFEPRERPPEAPEGAQVPAEVQPTPNQVPGISSPLSDLAASYGYGNGSSFTLPAEAGARSPIDALLEAASADIQYLRGEPFRTNEEQAMVEREKARIRQNYAIARQRAIDEAGAYNRPLGPILDELAREEQAALADVDQRLTTMAASERRSRLAESRNLLSYLEQLERARMMEAMGIEQALDEGDFARVAAILQAATGGQAGIGAAGNISGNILQYALGLGAQAREALGRSMQGLQDLSTLYWLARNTQPGA